MADTRHLRSYGRTKARTLKPRQAALVDALLPHLALPAAGAIDIADLFEGAASSPLAGEGRVGGASAIISNVALTPPPPTSPQGGREALDSAVVLEIGFGGGEHLVTQAVADPSARFIGVEPFLNGVASCLRHIEESGAANVRLHMGDARDVVARLPDASVDRVYILFPDPWPKARHWKRRLIQADFVTELARVLKPGGDVRFATDWKHYAAWTLETFVRDARFVWTAESAHDWRAPWEGHVATRYEQKRLGDCAPVFLAFRRAGMSAEAKSAVS